MWEQHTDWGCHKAQKRQQRQKQQQRGSSCLHCAGLASGDQLHRQFAVSFERIPLVFFS